MRRKKKKKLSNAFSSLKKSSNSKGKKKVSPYKIPGVTKSYLKTKRDTISKEKFSSIIEDLLHRKKWLKNELKLRRSSKDKWFTFSIFIAFLNILVFLLILYTFPSDDSAHLIPYLTSRMPINFLILWVNTIIHKRYKHENKVVRSHENELSELSYNISYLKIALMVGSSTPGSSIIDEFKKIERKNKKREVEGENGKEKRNQHDESFALYDYLRDHIINPQKK